MPFLSLNDIEKRFNLENNCKSSSPPNTELCIYICKPNKVNNFIF